MSLVSYKEFSIVDSDIKSVEKIDKDKVLIYARHSSSVMVMCDSESDRDKFYEELMNANIYQ